ncbi:MAG: hypothetical protein ACR2GG_04535 [Gemmatimonadaceae bacterium]
MKRCDAVAQGLARVLTQVLTRVGLAVAVGVAVWMPIACSTPPVEWGEIVYPSNPPVEQFRLMIEHEPAGACPESFRAALAGPNIYYGAWWHVRPDSSAVLMAGRSIDGGRTWITAVPADTTDRSRRGCDRPAPAIFADTASGYVDFAYFLEANEGPGIFFTHTMDAPHMGQGQGVFHSPVAIVYGEHPSRVAVAARGDDVAVAYEDPNAERPLIGVALSRTMGHIFKTRSDASSTDLPAVDPRVTLSGDTVTVQWSERPDSVKVGGRFALRRGKWR